MVPIGIAVLLLSYSSMYVAVQRLRGSKTAVMGLIKGQDLANERIGKVNGQSTGHNSGLTGIIEEGIKTIPNSIPTPSNPLAPITGPLGEAEKGLKNLYGKMFG